MSATVSIPTPRTAPARVAVLVPTRGPWRGTTLPTAADCTTLGRYRGCDLVLDDPTVSRHHAELHRDGKQYILLDTGSLNGVYVNRARTPRATLVDGDEIWIGTFRFAFRYPDRRPYVATLASTGPRRTSRRARSLCSTGSSSSVAAGPASVTPWSPDRGQQHRQIRIRPVRFCDDTCQRTLVGVLRRG